DQPAIVGGKPQNFTYGDCKKEMDMVNRAFIEVMIEGDANGRGFQYPIPTYSITRDFDWSETENNKLLFEMTAKYGTPYFSNYINSDMEPSDVRSMCCRLRLDLRELRKKSGGFFGSGESTGSIGVVTINLPRIAYLAKDEQDFYKQLDRLMDIAARSLKTKREVITQLLENGLYPYTKRYLGTFANHFSTIGLIGMNEVGLNAKWLRADLTHEKTQKFAQEVLDHMRERLSDYQEKYGDLYNLEATPAESTTYRFAKHDKEQYPDIITANENGTPYYTNSSHLPVGYTEDIFSALEVQDELQTRYTSGTVFHAFLGEKLPDWKAAADLVRKIAENFKLPYYTMSPTYSVCADHGYLAGEQYTCPHCGRKTEVYSRITGYYRPVQNWNDGKSQEFRDRKVYNVGTSTLRPQAQQPVVKEECPCCCEEEKAPVSENARVLLFSRVTCPNCRVAENLLAKAGVAYEKLIADEHVDLCKQFGIKGAPTLVVTDGENHVNYYSVPEIKKYLASL
ncbi:MAG: ribonucleoside triphosphate reductase, partial [Clostridia bacterium]|nr:ribonucleoside triphosphate reductase [Clostridia bacterium]